MQWAIHSCSTPLADSHGRNVVPLLRICSLLGSDIPYGPGELALTICQPGPVPTKQAAHDWTVGLG